MDQPASCVTAIWSGGSWNRDNVILFSPGAESNRQGSAFTGLMRVSSAGGAPTVVTTADPSMTDLRHRWPQFLPTDVISSTQSCQAWAVKVNLSRRSSVELTDTAAAAARFFRLILQASLAFGHLLFARGDTLMARPFDSDVRQFTGDAFPVAQRVSREGSRYVGASASANGTLVYALDSSRTTRALTWFNRAGRALATLGEASPTSPLRFHPTKNTLHSLWVT